MFKTFVKGACVAVVCVSLLMGCGSGGGGGAGSAGGITLDTTVNGLAATGAAIANASVTGKCAAGAIFNTLTAMDGTFSVKLSSAQTLPCVLRVTTGATTLYGFVDGYGRVNLTPLSDLALAYAGNDVPANVYNGFNSALANSLSTNMAGAKAYIKFQMRILDFSPVSIDPLNGIFAIGDNHDQILDQIQSALAANTKTFDDLRNVAKMRGELNTVLPTGKILISEVASGYFRDIPFWFEIVNVGNRPVNLSSYKIKTSGSTLNISPYTVGGSKSFALPNVTLAEGAFLVVSGQRPGVSANGSQLVYISGESVNEVPYWTDRGSLELLKNGATRDFVRFGANVDQPASYAVTYTAPALPFAVNTYGNSIVLPGNTAALMNPAGAWSSVAWTTPAGPNDVPAGAVDADGDGIPDSAEMPGGTFAGLDLYAMGARTGQRDVLIEVDYMASSDLGVIPQKQALDNVKAAFSSKGVHMMVDVGGLFGDALNAGYNWGGGQSVPNTLCVSLRPVVGCSGNLYQNKIQYFDIRRSSIFHYALFGTSQVASGVRGSSGVAELPGNDFLVTLGGWGLNTSTVAEANKLINYQAGTFMHELGHNLNLRHGGFEDANYKPNYFSVMNYLYQLRGLSSSASGIGPFERWKCVVVSPCVLTEPPQMSNNMAIDYSNGSSNNLDENFLSEGFNIGRGANPGVYADWNLSGFLDGGFYSGDINLDTLITPLRDFDDWSNIVWPFTRTYAGSFGAMQSPMSAPVRTVDPMSDDRQPFIVETLHAPAD